VSHSDDSIPGTTFAPLLGGRDRDIGMLRARLAATLAGEGSLVLIGGETGIGKTALAEELCREAAAHGLCVLVGRCYDLTETPPYGPWLDLFARVALPADMPCPPLALAGRDGVGAIASQASLFDQLRTFLVEATRQRPIVLLLGDLHWADPASLDLLRFVSRIIQELPVLILVTYRAEEMTHDRPLHRLIPLLVREAKAIRIELRPLSDDDVRALVEGRYTLPPSDSTRLVVYLQTRAQGNPLFIEELLRNLEGKEMLARAGDGWTLGDLSEARVPALLRQMIERRFAAISNEGRRLLAAAAVIGQEVPYDLWAAVTATGIEALQDVSESAIEAALLDETADGLRVRFRHPLIRAVLYETILPSRRRRMHRQAGEELALHAGADPDVVADHFRRAGDSRAPHWLARAGERAESALALLTAADRYEAAAALLAAEEINPESRNPAERGWLLHGVARARRYINPRQGLTILDEAAHLATSAGDAALSAATLRLRALLRCYVGEVHEGLPEMEAAATAVRALAPADRERLTERLGGSGFRDGDGYGTYVSWLGFVGRNAEARSRGERLVSDLNAPDAVHRDTGDVHAYAGLAQVYASLGLPDQAREAFDAYRAANLAIGDFAQVHSAWGHEAMFLYLPYLADRREERERLERETEQARMMAHGTILYPPRYMLQSLLFVEGAWDEIEAITRAVREAGVATMIHRGWACVLGPLARARGNAERAWSIIGSVFPAGPATEPGELNFLDVLPVLLLAADLALDTGDLPTARQWLEAHDRWVAWSGTVLGQAEGALGWSAYYRAAGDNARANDAATRAHARATTPRQPLALLAAHRQLGDLATQAGRYADADAHLTSALALADACAAPYERALTLLSLATARSATGDTNSAMASLGAARAIFAPLGATPALARAEALAAPLRVSSPVHPDGLTAREVDVLQAIASGKSNKQVALALSISVSTVERHISNLYAKIGAHNKADAASYAYRHRLA
jgi:DNA-binding CsgD family transcriptional regulator